MKQIHWFSTALLLAGFVAAEEAATSSTVPSATASAATSSPAKPPKTSSTNPLSSGSSKNSLGDFNRALPFDLDDVILPPNPYEKPKPRTHNHEASKWKRENSVPSLDNPDYARWLKPPEGPRQNYGCMKKKTPEEGLTMLEIKLAGRYMMWQLENSKLAFTSLSTDPENPCFPVYCHEDSSALVSICNRRSDMRENKVTIYGMQLGRLIWEMGVFVDLDSQFIAKPWDGGVRLCTDPESLKNRELQPESFIAWTGWSEDQWEITISKEKEGCRSWRGDPNWVTTGKGGLPADFPIDLIDIVRLGG